MLKRMVFAVLTASMWFAPEAQAQEQPAAPKGTLVIVGGGGVPDDILSAFLTASGGKGGRIGIIPSATSDSEGAFEEWRKDLAEAGMEMVPLDVKTREDAASAPMLAAAKTCTGFWFSGGDQVRIVDRIVGTPLQQLLIGAYRGGACVGGTSAGAAIMSQVMLTGEDMNGKESLREMGSGAYRTREGMGFLPEHCIIDQHFLKRSRQNRLFSLMMQHPDKLGLGIDEATALVVVKGQATVFGKSAVMVFDPSGMKQDASGGFQDMRIHLLTKGQALDLATRKVVLAGK